MEFDNYPDYFESRNENHKGKIQRKSGPLKEGVFYLMTDALSEWFIKDTEKAMTEIDSWKSQTDFENRIELLRKSEMANDDSAILIIKIIDDNKNELSFESISVSDIAELISIECKQKENEIIKNIDSKKNEYFESDMDEKIKQNVKIENSLTKEEMEFRAKKFLETLDEKYLPNKKI
jgi:hypothetical protein